MEFKNQKLNQDFLDEPLTPKSKVCLICLTKIDDELNFDDLQFTKEDSLVREQMGRLVQQVECSLCKHIFHKECLQMQALSDFRPKKGSTQYFQCDFCQHSKSSQNSCLVCGNSTGALCAISSLTQIGQQQGFAHLICLFFSANFTPTGKRPNEFTAISSEAIGAYSNSSVMGTNCQLCCRKIFAGDSYFECYCAFKSHVFCALYTRAVASGDGVEGDLEAARPPIPFLSRHKPLDAKANRISIETALALLGEDQKSALFESQDQRLMKLKLGQKLQQDSPLSQGGFVFEMHCGKCSQSKGQYCCHVPHSEEFIMCCICNDWIHTLKNCKEIDPGDKKGLEEILGKPEAPFRPGRGQSRPKNKRAPAKARQGESRGKGTKGGGFSQGQQDEIEVEELAESYKDKFFACKKCVNQALFVRSRLKNEEQLRFPPESFAAVLYFNRLVREQLASEQRGPKSGQSPLLNQAFQRQKTRSKLVLRLEDLAVSAWVLKAAESARSSNELECFETDLLAMLRSLKFCPEAFERLAEFYQTNVKPLSKDKDRRGEIGQAIAFFEELLSALKILVDYSSEICLKKFEKKLKRLFTHERLKTKKALINDFVKFVNEQFMRGLSDFLSKNKTAFSKANDQMSEISDRLLPQPTVSMDEVLQFLNSKVNFPGLLLDSLEINNGFLAHKCALSLEPEKELAEFLGGPSTKAPMPFEELSQRCQALLLAKSFDGERFAANARTLLERFSAAVAAKGSFDALRRKLENLHAFDPKTFLANLANIDLLATFDELAALKQSELSDVLFDGFFAQTESRSQIWTSQLTKLISQHTDNRKSVKVTKGVKAVLALIFREQILVGREVVQFIAGNVDQYKIKRVVHRQAEPLTLAELLALKTSVEADKCNRYIYQQFCTRTEHAAELEEKIALALKDQNFLNSKIAAKIAALHSEAVQLGYKNAALVSYKRNCDFAELLANNANQELHVDCTESEEFDFAKLDRYLDEQASIEALELLRAFKLERFEFREVEHAYKKAVSKYYEKLVELCLKGSRNMKVSWLKEDRQLALLFQEKARLPFEVLARNFRELEKELEGLLWEFGKDEDALQNARDYCEKLDALLEKAEKFEIDEPGLRVDLGFLFDLRVNLGLAHNMQAFLAAVRAEEQELSFASPSKTRRAPPDASSQLKDSPFTPNVSSIQYRANLTGQKSLEGEMVRQSEAQPALLAEQCRVAYDLIYSCSRYFQPIKDKKLEGLVREFKEMFEVFIKTRTELAGLNKRLQKSQSEPENFELKINEADVQSILPRLQKFRVFLKEGVETFTAALREHSIFSDRMQILAKEILQRSANDVLSARPVWEQPSIGFSTISIKNSETQRCYFFFKKLAKAFKISGHPFENVNKKCQNFLEFVGHNFEQGSEQPLLHSLASRLALSADVKELVEHLQQNESSEEVFRLHLTEIKNYCLGPGLKTCFNYESMAEFEAEVQTLDYLIANDFAGYLDSLNTRKTKMNPSDVLRTKIEDKLSKIQLLNSYFNETLKGPFDAQNALALYCFVKELTGRPCFGYDSKIVEQFAQLSKGRSEFHANLAFIDREVDSLCLGLASAETSQSLPENLVLDKYEGLQFKRLGLAKTHFRQEEKTLYTFKLCVLITLRTLLFSIAAKKPWMLKELFASEELNYILSKLDKLTKMQPTLSRQRPNIFCTCYELIVFAMRVVIGNLSDGPKLLKEKFPSGFAQRVESQLEGSKPNLLNNKPIGSYQDFVSFGHYNFLPSVRFVFGQVNAHLSKCCFDEFTKMIRLIGENKSARGGLFNNIHLLKEKIRKIPFITKNESTYPLIDSLCVCIGHRIKEEEALRAKNNPPEKPDASKSINFQRVVHFVTQLPKRSSLCQRLEKSGFSPDEFWALYAESDGRAKVFESPSSANEFAKSEKCSDSWVKKEEFLNSNGSSHIFIGQNSKFAASEHCLSEYRNYEKCPPENCKDLKKIKESTSRSYAENFFDFIDVRIFKLIIGDCFLAGEKLNLVFLTRQNPFCYSFISKVELYFKSITCDFQVFAQIFKEKSSEAGAKQRSRKVIAGWLEPKSLKGSPAFFESLKQMGSDKFVREKFLICGKGHEIYIGAYTALDNKMLRVLDFTPSYSDKQIDLADVFAFFIKPNEGKEEFVSESDCRENFEVYEKIDLNQEEVFDYGTSWLLAERAFSGAKQDIIDDILKPNFW